MKKKTLKEFINQSKLVHGDKYDYSKAEYVDARTKICIVCPKHGEFWQKPADHIRGIGCEKCKFEKIALNNTYTTDVFITKCKNKYGDKYDYSKVEYKDNKTKVCIICPEHGEFWQTPNKFLSGRACVKCADEERRLRKEKSFIERSKEIHNNKYDYSKVKYINNHTKVCIICPEHGEFWQTPNGHLSGQGCNLCFKPMHNAQSFIEEAKKIHGDKYDYSKVEYKTAKKKVCIICPEHGEFWQTPSAHVSARCGCPSCKESKLELETRKYLTENNINFIFQKRFNWLGLQTLDFYLPERNMAIECQGIQHFEPIDFAGKGKRWANKLFKDNIKRDELKRRLCEENGIKIIYVDYKEKVKEQLENKINN